MPVASLLMPRRRAPRVMGPLLAVALAACGGSATSPGDSTPAPPATGSLTIAAPTVAPESVTVGAVVTLSGLATASAPATVDSLVFRIDGARVGVVAGPAGSVTYTTAAAGAHTATVAAFGTRASTSPVASSGTPFTAAPITYAFDFTAYSALQETKLMPGTAAIIDGVAYPEVNGVIRGRVTAGPHKFGIATNPNAEPAAKYELPGYDDDSVLVVFPAQPTRTVTIDHDIVGGKIRLIDTTDSAWNKAFFLERYDEPGKGLDVIPDDTIYAYITTQPGTTGASSTFWPMNNAVLQGWVNTITNVMAPLWRGTYAVVVNEGSIPPAMQRNVMLFGERDNATGKLGYPGLLAGGYSVVDSFASVSDLNAEFWNYPSGQVGGTDSNLCIVLSVSNDCGTVNPSAPSANDLVQIQIVKHFGKPQAALVFKGTGPRFSLR
ncbi:MAG TPA: hypothetical protein VNF92_06970 [Gemmatimonadaceae bacterium]|nr:hypothetical protein [Gemmatimonadaceae bacterium]